MAPSRGNFVALKRSTDFKRSTTHPTSSCFYFFFFVQKGKYCRLLRFQVTHQTRLFTNLTVKVVNHVKIVAKFSNFRRNCNRNREFKFVDRNSLMSAFRYVPLIRKKHLFSRI